MLSNADLFLITSVEPITCTNSLLRKSASSLVTVSRNDPIICAICSCVSVSLLRTCALVEQEEQASSQSA
jgi:hypothetical protein